VGIGLLAATCQVQSRTKGRLYFNNQGRTTDSPAVPVQDRKRQLDGAPKASLQHHQGPPPAAAAAGWGSTAGPTSAAKRLEVTHNSSTGAAAAAAAAAWAQPQPGAAGAADDPIEVDDEEDGTGSLQHQQLQDCGNGRAGGALHNRWSGPPPLQPGRRQQQPTQHQGGGRQGSATGSADAEDDAAAAGGGGGGRPGFKSARAQLVTDLRKKGQHQQANMFANQVRGVLLCIFMHSDVALMDSVTALNSRVACTPQPCRKSMLSTGPLALALASRVVTHVNGMCFRVLSRLVFACTGTTAPRPHEAQGGSRRRRWWWWWWCWGQVWLCAPLCGQGHRAPHWWRGWCWWWCCRRRWCWG